MQRVKKNVKNGGEMTDMGEMTWGGRMEEK